MSFLPIVERELRVAARLRQTILIRLGAVLVAAAIGAFYLMSAQWAPRPGWGGELFRTLGVLMLLLCLFEGLRASADSISREIREGTLGFLFLGGLRGYDVVMGKAVAANLQTFYALLAAGPILGLTVPMGGVTGGELIRIMISLGAGLWIATALGLAVSSHHQEGTRAFRQAAILGAAWCGLPPAAAFLAVRSGWSAGQSLSLWSPVGPFLHASDTVYRAAPWTFWVALAFGAGCAGGLFALASRRVRRAWTGGEKRRSQAWCQPSGRVQRRAEARLGDGNPVAWLARRGRTAQMRSWVAASAAVVVLHLWLGQGGLAGNVLLFGSLGAGVLLGWGIRVALALEVGQAFAGGSPRELLALLASTPMDNVSIVEGHREGLTRTWAGPTLMAIALMAAPALARLASTTAVPLSYQYVELLRPGLFAATLLVDLQAIFYVGIWFSLRTVSPNTSVLRTLGLTQLLPAVFCCGFSIVASVAAWVWARRSVQRDLRRMLERAPVG